MNFKATAAALSLSSFVALSGCIPYKKDAWLDAALNPAAPGSDKKIKVGDQVRVRTLQGKTYLFTVRSLADDGFTGVQKGPHQFQIKYKDLKWAEVWGEKWDVILVGFSPLSGI